VRNAASDHGEVALCTCTAHQLSLADIQGRDPLDNLLFVLRLFQQELVLLTVIIGNRRWLPAGAAGTVTKLTRVLEVTLKGPTTQLPVPD
jgi:hypothetical protein